MIKKTSVLFLLVFLFSELSAQHYNVYTAILNPPPINIQTSGSLIVGKRYRVENIVSGDNFSNVSTYGNVSYHEFIAQASNPNNWSNGTIVYEILPPTVTVLQNTIGNIIWKRDDPGIYEAYLPGAFPKGRTAVFITNVAQSNSFVGANWANSGDPDGDGWSDWVDFAFLNSNGSGSDYIALETTIEIRIYF